MEPFCRNLEAVLESFLLRKALALRYGRFRQGRGVIVQRRRPFPPHLAIMQSAYSLDHPNATIMTEASSCIQSRFWNILIKDLQRGLLPSMSG